MSQLKDTIRLRAPRALAFYQRHVAPRLMKDSRLHDLSVWAARGPEIVAATGMHGIRFDRDGTWIDDGNGYLWAYTPGVFGSALGAELGLRYEAFEIGLLADRLPAGGVLVDVGANAGLHCVQLARTVDDLTVHAFEPVASTYDVLQRNIAKNGVGEHIHTRRMAVAEREGTLRLTNTLHLGNFVVPDGETAAQEVVEEVPSRPLDDVLDELGVERVDAIKCDVEGAELGVLRGAVRTLERSHPMLLLEIDERWAKRYGHTGADVVEFLTERGYGYERIVGEALLPASGSLAQDLREGTNFLFTAA